VLTGLAVRTGRVVVPARLEDGIAAPMAGPAAVDGAVLGFVPLADGNVVAVDLARGGIDGPVIGWRAGVGGVPNRKPVVTPDAVYTAGDHAGVAKVDIRTGDLLWRTTGNADRVLAVTAEYVYVRDRAGNLLVYPKGGAAGGDRLVDPVGRLPVASFNVPVTNDRTDRILLAADNGLLVSLRDADPRFALPARVSPPAAPPLKAPEPPPGGPGETPPTDPPKNDGL
jgi:hypothetical protein